MPVTGQQLLPLFDAANHGAGALECSHPNDSSVADSKETKDTSSGKSRTPSFVIDSTTRFWPGTSDLKARSFTLQLTSDGNLQLFATSPNPLATTSAPAESSGLEADFISEHRLPAALPGQFWCQPALCSTSPAAASSLPLSWPATIDGDLLSLESGLLWDIGDQAALKKVTFGGKDLLGIYNQDLLRHRLITAGSPVTRAGHSVAHKSLPTKIAKSTEFAPEDVAFVLDIDNTKPCSEVIVGLVIELSADANTKESSWPRFLSIFGRRVDVPSSGKQSKSRTLELPLCLEEMFIPQTPLHLCVGRSQHPDGLTSIDTVRVYSVPRAHLDPSMLPSWPVARSEQNCPMESGACSPSEKRAGLYNAALVNWMDRILTTGFITDALRNHSGAPSRPNCAFVSPTYETSDLAVLLSSCSATSDYAENASNACVLPTVAKELEPLAIDCLRKVSLTTFSNSPQPAPSPCSAAAGGTSHGLTSRLL
ncbi:unnamed protein product, partial [Dibothriocephalus latus]